MSANANEITRIVDMIVPDKYANITAENATRDLVLMQSGLLATNDRLDNLRQSDSGVSINMPIWKPLSAEPAPLKEGVDMPVYHITSTKMAAIRHIRGSGIAATDLSTILGSGDPMQEMANQSKRIYAEHAESMVYATLEGVMNTPDMAKHVLDVSYTPDPQPEEDGKKKLKALGDSNGPADENRFNARTILRALGLLGDRHRMIDTIIVHSAVMNSLRERNLISSIPESRSEVAFETYLNKRIIETDLLPYDAENNKFTSYLFGRGVIGYSAGYCPGLIPVELMREARKSQSTLFNRMCSVVHPIGFSWKGAETTETTNEQLKTPGNWKRVYELRNIPMLKVISSI